MPELCDGWTITRGGGSLVLGYHRGHLFALIAAILCVAGIGWFALAYFIPAPPTQIAIGTGFKGGEYDRFVTCDPIINTKGIMGEMRVPFIYAKDGTLHAIVLRDNELFRLELVVTKE